MSDAHDTHDAHVQDPPDITNPLLWTVGLVAICSFLVWLFFHFLDEGRITGRDHGVIELQRPLEAEPDHLSLIETNTVEVREMGQQLYLKNCAACHGQDGHPASVNNRQARDFHTDRFTNPQGGGPFGFYSVITHGLGAMPPVPAVDPAGRYAIAHFIRETWVKTDNAANYVEKDSPQVLASLPKPGAAKEEGPKTPPNEQPVPETMYPLLHAIADDADREAEPIRRWLAAARGFADQRSAADLRQLEEFLLRRLRLGTETHRAALAGDAKRFQESLLSAAPISGEGSAFAVMPVERMAALFDAARKAAAEEGGR
jgi:hypothetical protein